MTSISSSYSNYSQMQMRRPDPSQMASKLFSKLDTKNQGYLEKSDLQSALSSISGDSSSSDSDVDALFSQLDSDSDGKVTKDEMTTQLQKLAEQLDSQFSQMRMQGGMGGAQGMPPPPPQGQDSGFTKDELSSQLEEIGSSDSKRSDLISSIVNNFEAADTDGDGKVTAKEAMAYEQSQKSSSSSDSSSSTSTSSSNSTSTEARLMHQIMELMRAYGGNEQSAYSSTLSASA